MSQHEDGGPAFPFTDDDNYCRQGMSLRDYFAAKAMQGLMADSNVCGTPDEIACAAYEIADAMIKARGE